MSQPWSEYWRERGDEKRAKDWEKREKEIVREEKQKAKKVSDYWRSKGRHDIAEQVERGYEATERKLTRADPMYKEIINKYYDKYKKRGETQRQFIDRLESEGLIQYQGKVEKVMIPDSGPPPGIEPKQVGKRKVGPDLIIQAPEGTSPEVVSRYLAEYIKNDYHKSRERKDLVSSDINRKIREISGTPETGSVFYMGDKEVSKSEALGYLKTQKKKVTGPDVIKIRKASEIDPNVRKAYEKSTSLEKIGLHASTLLSESGYTYLGSWMSKSPTVVPGAYPDPKDVVLKKMTSETRLEKEDPLKLGPVEIAQPSYSIRQGLFNPAVEVETAVAGGMALRSAQATVTGAKILGSGAGKTALMGGSALFLGYRAFDVGHDIVKGDRATALGKVAVTGLDIAGFKYGYKAMSNYLKPGVSEFGITTGQDTGVRGKEKIFIKGQREISFKVTQKTPLGKTKTYKGGGYIDADTYISMKSDPVRSWGQGTYGYGYKNYAVTDKPFFFRSESQLLTKNNFIPSIHKTTGTVWNVRDPSVFIKGMPMGRGFTSYTTTGAKIPGIKEMYPQQPYSVKSGRLYQFYIKSDVGTTATIKTLGSDRSLDLALSKIYNLKYFTGDSSGVSTLPSTGSGLGGSGPTPSNKITGIVGQKAIQSNIIKPSTQGIQAGKTALISDVKSGVMGTTQKPTGPVSITKPSSGSDLKLVSTQKPTITGIVSSRTATRQRLGLSQPSKTRQKTRTKALVSTGHIGDVLGKTYQGSRSRSDTTTLLGTGHVSGHTSRSDTSTKTKTKTSTAFSPTTITGRSPGLLRSRMFRSLDISPNEDLFRDKRKSKKSVFRSTGIRSGYSPSLLGALSGKKTKKPGIITGFGIRYPLKRKSKKKSKDKLGLGSWF